MMLNRDYSLNASVGTSLTGIYPRETRVHSTTRDTVITTTSYTISRQTQELEQYSLREQGKERISALEKHPHPASLCSQIA